VQSLLFQQVILEMPMTWIWWIITVSNTDSQ
jgi:hypothetical protein